MSVQLARPIKLYCSECAIRFNYMIEGWQIAGEDEKNAFLSLKHCAVFECFILICWLCIPTHEVEGTLRGRRSKFSHIWRLFRGKTHEDLGPTWRVPFGSECCSVCRLPSHLVEISGQLCLSPSTPSTHNDSQAPSTDETKRPRRAFNSREKNHVISNCWTSIDTLSKCNMLTAGYLKTHLYFCVCSQELQNTVRNHRGGYFHKSQILCWKSQLIHVRQSLRSELAFGLTGQLVRAVSSAFLLLQQQQ